MTQDEIIRMAREAELYSYLWGGDINQQSLEALERFAALVAAHEREKTKAVFEELEREVKAELINAINGAVELEREACAKVCDEPSYVQQRAKTSAECAAAIRARGNNK